MLIHLTFTTLGFHNLRLCILIHVLLLKIIWGRIRNTRLLHVTCDRAHMEIKKRENNFRSKLKSLVLLPLCKMIYVHIYLPIHSEFAAPALPHPSDYYPFGKCMSSHNHFSHVLVKINLLIGQFNTKNQNTSNVLVAIQPFSLSYFCSCRRSG